MEEKLINIKENYKEEESPETKKLIEKYGYLGQDPYTSASCISNTFLYWAYKIIKLGNLIKLKPEYLGKLTGKYRSEIYLEDFKEVWEKKRYKNKKKLALIRAGFRANINFVIFMLFFTLFRSLLNIIQITIFREFISRFNKKEEIRTGFYKNFTHWNVGILYLLLRVIEVFAMRKCFEYQMLLGFKSGTELSCIIFEKLLKISPASLKEKSKSGEVINYIQVDAHRLTFLMLSSPDLLTMPLQIIVFSYMLFKFFGWNFIFGLITLIFFLYLNFKFQIKMKKLMFNQMKIKDKRMKVTTETFNNIKILKLYSWEDEFLKRINKERDNELTSLTNIFKIGNIAESIGWLAPIATSITSIGAYQYFHDKLKIEDIFTCLGIFSQLQFPIRMLPGVINNFYQTSISMGRIEKYLSETEINDNVVIRYDKESEKKGIDILIENGKFTWGGDYNSSKNISNFNYSDIEKKAREGKNIFDFKKNDKNKSENDVELSSNIKDENTINTSKKKLKDFPSKYSSIGNDIENKINEISSIGINEERNLKPVLNNINLEIKKGELVCIIGEVGSGKSSLLQSILNNMISLSNNSKIIINGSISYVSQIPWIRNATVKDNILFFNKYDEEKYNKSIELSELRADLDILEGGDLTEIGEKGVNLSGGQKARVTLARAIYSDKDIYLFDDPISALDANVGMNVMKNCIIKYLKNKTRILVTHALQYVSFADKIIYMKDGEINWMGTYNEIKEKEFFKIFYDKMNERIDGLKKKSSSEIREEFLKDNPSPKRMIPQGINFGNMNPDFDSDEEESFKEKKNGKIKRITKDEMKEEGKVKFKVYKEYITYIGGFIMIFIFIGFLLLSNAFKGASDMWLGYWSEHQNKKKNNFYFFIYSILGLSSCIINYFSIRQSSNCSIKASKIIHEKMVDNLIKAPICTFHETTPKGQIFNRLSKDIDNVDGRSMREVNGFFSCIVSFISSFIICTIYQPYSILFLPFMGIIGYKISRFYSNCSREMFRLEGIVRSPTLNLLNETIPGTTTIRAFQYQKKYLQMFQEKSDDNLKMRIVINGVNQWFDLMLDLLSLTFIIFLIVYTTYNKDKYSAEFIGIMLTYWMNLQRSLIHGLHVMSFFENSMVGIERCLQYTNITSEEDKKKKIDETLINWPQEGKIEFINFSARYRPDTDIVLKKINFEILPKQKIGIAGRTGSGKSTITLCLFRILEALEGKILIDEIDISSIGLDKLRSNLTIIPQDPTLMEGTLRYNIDPLNKYNDNEILEIMKKIGFDYIINNNEKGLQQNIEEGGENLSVGEKQLICICRAILRKSKIIVMDEATANIDYKTEEIIQKAINDILSNSTIITIAHRIKTIMNYDKILILDNGSVANFDSPNNLLKNKEGIFYELYTKSTL